MLGQVAAAENAAMHFWMQSFDTAVEHFRKAGVVGNIGDRQPGLAQQLGGAAGGEQRDAELREAARELDDALFIGNAEQRLGDFHRKLRKRMARK